MRRSRPWLLLVLALGSGALATFLALRYIKQQSQPLLAREPSKAQVVLAARSLQVGTVIEPEDIKLVSWPGNALPAGYVASASEAVGRGITTPVAENEPLMAVKLASKEAGGGLPIIIKDGMRAVSVRVDEIIGVAGFVLPGTRVDVMVTLDKSPEENRPQAITKTILQNVQTLAAGQQVQRDVEGKPQTVTAITLLVTPDEAELLALAAKEGRIQLALRNPIDTLAAPTAGAHTSEFGGTFSPTPPRPATPVRVRPTPPRPDDNKVIIEGYRGGERTLTTFQAP